MERNRIYYIEDDESIGADVSAYLAGKGYEVTVLSAVSEAKNEMNRQPPALCLIDWNLPDGSGEELCRWLKSRWSGLPIIFVTVKDQVPDIVQGFRIGADDYITKPFDLEILHVRIDALLRRTGGADGILTCGPLSLDTDTYRVWDNGAEIPVSAAEFQILLLLMRNKNRTVTRKLFLETIWDANGNYVNDNTLTVTMKRLRGKLQNPETIKTIRSFGYRMEELWTDERK